MEKHIQEMKRIGLQEYESKAYYVLLTQGNLNAKEISLKAEIPQPKVYSILSNLIKKGLCCRVLGQNRQYKAFEPKIAFSPMKSEIEEQHVYMETVIKNLEKINMFESTKSMDDYIEVLTNNEQIHEKYLSLKKTTKHELIAFVKPPYAHEGNRSRVEKQDEVDSQRLKNGIVSKAIYEIPTTEFAKFIIPHIEKNISEGGEAKMLEKVPIKLHIFDERFVLMALNNSHNSSTKLTMLAIEHPDLARSNKILFEHLWERAIPFEEYKSRYLTNKELTIKTK